MSSPALATAPPRPSIPLDQILNLQDFAHAAEQTLKPKTWAYYASSADDGKTIQHNSAVYRMVRFRPRVLVDVVEVDTRTKILGYDSRHPFFIAPAAMGRLAHPEGELCLVRGAAATGIHYAPSTMSSVSHKDLAEAARPEQTLFFQLYMNRDRKKVEQALINARELGYKAILLTVDTPIPGNRELDLRTSIDPESSEVIDEAGPASAAAPPPGAHQLAIAAAAQFIDASLNWQDIAWVKKVSGLPVVVKGVQTVEDALLCVEYGAEGMMLSNHGGRQVDTTATPLETLLEIRRHAPHILGNIEIILDSGIRRGTDVVIALCLGATAVSLARPFMYSLIYGDAGVARCAELLADEVGRAMRLLGATSIKDLRPELVNVRELERKIWGGAKL